MKTSLLCLGVLLNSAIDGMTFANAASWQETGRYFYSLLDVGINDKSAGYVAALADGVGSIWLKSSTLGQNWTLVEERDGFFDLACTSLSPKEAAMTGLMGKGLYTLDGGATVHDTVGFVAGSQSLSRNRYANQAGAYLYGSPAGEGMSVSTDFGATYTHHKAADINASRYAALPSPDVWYITAGLWAEDDTSDMLLAKGFDTKHALNSKVELWYSSQSKRSRVHFKGFQRSTKKDHGTNKRKLSQMDAIWGAIYKTSDAGQSWMQVYESYGEFYFNAIDCCTEDLCYAVAEGDSDAGSANPGTRILQTQDGGQTWNIVYFNQLDGASLMAVHCVDSNNAWAAGGTIIERDFHGDFLYSSDNGNSWTDFQVNVPILYMDMSDDSSTGMASGLTKSGEGVAFGFY